MSSLADHIDNLAHNQHGAILGYVRKPDGRLEGPMTLELFVLNGHLTCPDLEKLRRNDPGQHLAFDGEVIELNGAIKRVLACGDILIALAD